MSYEQLTQSVDNLAVVNADLKSTVVTVRTAAEASRDAAQAFAIDALGAASEVTGELLAADQLAGLAAEAKVNLLRQQMATTSGGSGIGHRATDLYAKLSDIISTIDFVGDDVSALTLAEAYCSTNKKVLRIDKDLTILSLPTPLIMRCGLQQQPGTTINIINSGITAGLFKFTTSQTGKVISGIGGLTEGNTKLTGLPATPPGSWLLIESTEELIKDTSAGAYVKQEIAVIADILGGLTSPLNTTYTSAVVTLFTPEPSLMVSGLTIKGNGAEITNTSHNLVEVYRRGAVFDGFDVSGVPNRGSQIKFNQTPMGSLKNPNIVGHTVGNGYGILAFMTENLFIEHPTITNCRHAYAARHDKNTLIVGGTMAEIIDSHWGQNLVIMGCTVIGQIQYAGRDLSVTGCQQTPKDYCIRLRNTSPELKGRVVYRDNVVNLDSRHMLSTHFAYITFGLSSGTFTFGRNLVQPSLVTIKDNHLNIISMPSNITYARMLTSQGFEYSLSTRFEIEGNTRTDYTKTMDVLTGFVKADNVDFTVNPTVYVRGEKNCRISITSQNTLPNLGKGFSLELHELTDFILFTNTNALVDSKLFNVTCAGWALPAGGTQANVDNGKLQQFNMTFNGALPFECSRIMTGEIFFKNIPDDTVVYFKPSREFGHLSVLSQNSLQWSGMAGYDVQASGVFNQTIYAGAGFATTTGVLTGTTGVDGNLTISPALDGKLYLENRAGAALTLQCKELNMS